MAYATYTTEALVCGSHNHLTSDRSYLLFTKEAGMLWATAKSVREEKSKQRSALQDFSFVRVSLVKGRGSWRVGSVEAMGNPFLAARSRSERAHITHIVSLLRRYIHGEQRMGEIFSDVSLALRVSILNAKPEMVAQVFAIRLLNALGYVSVSGELAAIVNAANLAAALAAYNPQHEARVAAVVARAHESSHL